VHAARVLLAGLAALVLVVVAAAWIVPGQLTWDRYRDTVTGLASSALGRPVRIEGPIGLTLLPQPILTAAAVSVADPGDGVSMAVDELRLRVGLGALLAGHVEARSVFLSRATLHLPWPLAPGVLTRRPPAWLHGFKAYLENSRLLIGDFELSAINGDLAADADTGALSASGTVRAMDRPWRVTARIGRPGSDGAATIEASLDGQDGVLDTGGSFSGQVAPDGGVAGRVTGRGPDLSLLLAAPTAPWRAQGRLTASGGLVVADELALDVGGAPAKGAVALRLLPALRLDVAFAASRIDLDGWLPRLLHWVPASLPTGIDVSAEAATFAGGTLRHLRAGFEATPQGVIVRAAEAVGPGEAEVHLDGRARDTHFEGTGRLRAPDLRTTLRWLRQLAPALADALPPNALTQANVASDVQAGPDSVTLGNVQGRLNDAAVHGSAALTLGPRPALAAKLTLDGLLLDPWIMTPPASLPDLARRQADLLGRLKGFDADLALDLPHAVWRDTRLSTLALDAKAINGRLDLQRLQAVADGFRLSASGQMGPDGRVIDGMIDLAMPDATPIANLPVHGPATLHAALDGPANAVGVVADAELGDLRVGARIRLDPTVPHASGPVSLRHPGAPRLVEALGLQGAAAWLGDGSLSLLAQFDAKPGQIRLDGADLSAGALRATMDLSWDQNDGRPMLSGNLSAETLPLPLPFLRSPDPLPLGWLRGFDAALHVRAAQVLAGLSPVLDQADAELTLKQGVVQARKASGTLSTGQMTGDATFVSMQAPPRLTVSGRVSGLVIGDPLFETVPDLAAGRVDAAIDLSATGYSPAALMAAATGTLRMTARDGVLAGLDAAAAAAALAGPPPGRIEAGVRAALSGGVTQFTRLDAEASLTHGVATLGPVTVRLPTATVSASGTVDMPASTIALRATIEPVASGLPTVGLQLIGSATDPSRTIEVAGLARWLAERPAAAVQ